MVPKQAHLHVMTNNPTKYEHILSYRATEDKNKKRFPKHLYLHTISKKITIAIVFYCSFFYK